MSKYMIALLSFLNSPKFIIFMNWLRKQVLGSGRVDEEKQKDAATIKDLQNAKTREDKERVLDELFYRYTK